MQTFRKCNCGKCKGKYEVTNRDIASYNPYLLLKHRCHINVTYVGGVKMVKYIYKYIYKGHDQASLKIVGDNQVMDYREDKTHVDGRYVCFFLFSNITILDLCSRSCLENLHLQSSRQKP